MKATKFCFLSFIILWSAPLFTQVELIPNGGFEEYEQICVDDCGDGFDCVVSWFNPTTRTPDWFHTLNTIEFCAIFFVNVEVPDNWMANAYPWNGNGYAGILTYGISPQFPDIINAHEYLSVKLNDTLYVGHTYTFSMYAMYGDKHRFYSNGLGIHFFENDSFVDKTANAIVLEPHFFVETPIPPSSDWTQITGTFTADKPYTYMTIGNFLHDSDERFIVMDTSTEPIIGSEYAVYLIDEVSLIPEPVPAFELEEQNPDCDMVVLESPLLADSYLWSTGEQTPTITVTESGEYWLEVNRHGQTRRDTVSVSIVGDHGRIYPNPSSGHLTLSLSSEDENPTPWQLFDMSGRLVKNGMLPTTRGTMDYELDFNGLSSGAYLLRFTTSCGEVVVKKVIVAR